MSLGIAVYMGMEGSDTGGLTAILLVLAAVAVVGYHFLGAASQIKPGLYGVLVAGGLAVAGLGLGVMTRGEEVFGFTTGLGIDFGAGLIVGATRAGAKNRQ